MISSSSPDYLWSHTTSDSARVAARFSPKD